MVLGRSAIVGMPMMLLLQRANATARSQGGAGNPQQSEPERSEGTRFGSLHWFGLCHLMPEFERGFDKTHICRANGSRSIVRLMRPWQLFGFISLSLWLLKLNFAKLGLAGMGLSWGRRHGFWGTVRAFGTICCCFSPRAEKSHKQYRQIVQKKWLPDRSFVTLVI